MPTITGTRLGPYEVVAPLGAGGMGEVYRARDSRLGREVAVKILPASLAEDADRQRRFENEARSAARLSHPNILQIYDVGRHEDRPYLVTELLDGETLRERMGGAPLPVRRAVEIAIAVANGLAAAHDQGIVHRDLKPENLFVTRDGRVKILDFGLAKLTRPAEDESGEGDSPTAATATAVGIVLGTAGYMSPEQVRGQPVDQRSDIFSFGAILYEMVSGRRAFRGESPADTMSAILREDPPELAIVCQGIPPLIERIVRRCLEKSPDLRFRSAHDLAFHLEGISTASGSGAVAALPDGGAAPARTPVSFKQLAFRRGLVFSGRFAPDGHTVIYSATWDGEPNRLFMKRPESPDAIPLALPSAGILAISPTGEMAIQLNPRTAHNGVWRGTLALAPLFGGAPREIAEDVMHADFAPGDGGLAVVRDVGGKGRLEYPLERVLYETPGHVSFPSVSPDGRRIAFLDHPLAGDDRGVVAVVDLDGGKTTLTEVWSSAQGLAWSPSGEEIWFTAAKSGGGNALWAVSLSGELRNVSTFPGGVRLLDLKKEGRVLLSRDGSRSGILGRAPGETKERDFSWLDWSVLSDLSPDGRAILFDEENDEVGANYLTCIRRTDGSPVMRLGEGSAKGLSPDARWALAQLPVPDSPLTLLPTGTGKKRTLETRGIECRRGRWLPDSRRVLWLGRGAGDATRAEVIDVEQGASLALALERRERASGVAVSPDGRAAIVSFPGETIWLPLDGSEPRPGPPLEKGERVVGISGDGRWLWVEAEAAAASIRVDRIDLEQGAREAWRELVPADPSGMVRLGNPIFSADGEAWVYSYHRVLSDLYVVEGLA